MLLRALARVAIGCAALSFAAPAALAQAGTAPLDAKAWLSRIHDAASLRNYQGTMVLSAGGTMSSSRIAHFCDGSQRFERSEMLDGQMRKVFRHNELVTTLWPADKVALVEQREATVAFPALLQSSLEPIFERYDLRAEGMDRVAGHAAQVLLLQPRDAWRFAQRLWSEKVSGLLLRADTLAADGRVLESAAFSEITIGVRSQPETVVQPMKRLDGYRVVRSASTRTQLDAEGWAIKSALPAGFRAVSCVKRPPGISGGNETLQAIYSDGLTHVSLFIEPFNPEHHKPMAAAIGATHTLMLRHTDWWVTVVGDVPMPTLKVFAAALERKR